MKDWMKRFRRSEEKHREYNRMVSELSEIDPRELGAILHIAPREIEAYCRDATFG